MTVSYAASCCLATFPSGFINPKSVWGEAMARKVDLTASCTHHTEIQLQECYAGTPCPGKNGNRRKGAEIVSHSCSAVRQGLAFPASLVGVGPTDQAKGDPPSLFVKMPLDPFAAASHSVLQVSWLCLCFRSEPALGHY